MKVDMSPESVTARLRRVAQLRRLCLALAKAQPAAAKEDRPVPPPADTPHGKGSTS